MYKDKTLKVGTFFTGIGSPEKAIERLKDEGYIKDYKVEFFSEIDNNAVKSYCTIHNISEDLNLGDITKIKGNNLPYCDIWIGGFPCQDISVAGKMKGFESNTSTRSSLGWEMIRLLKEVEIMPEYVIFENVSAIKSKRFKETLDLFKEDLTQLGYTLYDDLLCATNYGVPQTRTRYFLIAIKDKNKIFKFPEKIETSIKLKDLLDVDVDEKYYLTDSTYAEKPNKRVFRHKIRNNIEYEVDMSKFASGGICGVDKHTKFEISSRLFSIYGNAPTLTASNTADNSKIVVESESD